MQHLSDLQHKQNYDLFVGTRGSKINDFGFGLKYQKGISSKLWDSVNPFLLFNF
jgi:hypothetical protein